MENVLYLQMFYVIFPFAQNLTLNGNIAIMDFLKIHYYDYFYEINLGGSEKH